MLRTASQPAKGEQGFPPSSPRPLDLANASLATLGGREGKCLTQFDRLLLPYRSRPVAPSKVSAPEFPQQERCQVSNGMRELTPPVADHCIQRRWRPRLARDIDNAIAQQYRDELQDSHTVAFDR